MKYIAIVALFFVSGCVKDGYTSNSALLINNTSHKIELIPIYHGVIVQQNRIVLLPTESREISTGTTRGIAKPGSGFSSNFLVYADSFHVVFDDSLSVSHYGNDSTNLASRYHLASSNRNIGNPISYESSILKDNKTHRINSYKYTFTEQDYQFAQ